MVGASFWYFHNLLLGFDDDGTPRLYQTDPSGTYHCLEVRKHYTDEVADSDDETMKIAIKALLEVVQSGGKNIELAVMKKGETLKILQPDEVDKFVEAIEKERKQRPKRRRKKKPQDLLNKTQQKFIIFLLIVLNSTNIRHVFDIFALDYCNQSKFEGRHHVG
ncbi:Proteasome subunit alpha type-7 [Desmophyllum pertusum]|uniref:Proteasome subunit alpha type-7 n=1 Tax=Desmophyllum pertusum TaxID=174260 RepID=A0A9X0CC22_9CNID|nr:Proteasome subunit alpha type-7 [Desmophyllum pertusum]